MKLPDYKCHATRKSTSGILAFSLFIAVLGAVAAIVILFAGDRAPKGSGPWMIGGLIATVLGVVTAVIVYYTSRIRMTIHSEEHKLLVEVADSKLPEPFVIQYPFTTRMQHTEHYVPRRGHMKRLFYTISDRNDQPQLTFCMELGTIYNPPAISEFINYKLPGESEKLRVAHRVYDSGDTENFARELNARLRFIERALVREGQASQ